MLVPDLGVTCVPPTTKVEMPDPLILIEILSAGNETRTRANVRAYTTIESVVEIVMLQSLRVGAEVLRRRADGSWPDDFERVDPDGTLKLVAIDFEAPLRDVYRTTILGEQNA